MSSRESFFGCTYEVGGVEVLERVVRAWDPGEAFDAFLALLGDAGERRPGVVTVRDGLGRLCRRAPFPAARRGGRGRGRAPLAAR